MVVGGVHDFWGVCMVARGRECMVVGGHAWLPGGGHAWLLGGHEWLPGGVHGCWGACVVAWGGIHGCRGAWLWGACIGYDEIRSMSGRYASYWNAFLLEQILIRYLLAGKNGYGS